MAVNEPNEADDLAERLAAYEESGRQPAADDTPSALDADIQQRLVDNQGFLDFLAQSWPTAEAAFPPAPLGSFGRFQVLRELGRGGFGLVFLAWDPTHQRHVALKLPRLETLVTPGARRLFLREAQIAAELDHPHLVRVYEAGEMGPICYLAGAYSPGYNLAEWLRHQPQPVPPRQAAELVALLADAVAFLHARGILHRDLKPTNVLLEMPPGAEASSFGVPRITDFGLARLMERPSGDETTSGVIAGSPRYMAPEQALDRRDQIGPATDVYALGVLVYEVLTGTTPFQGRTPLDVFRHMLTGDPPRLRRLRPDIPPVLEAIAERCLHPHPRRRYAGAADLAADLTRFVRGERVSVRPAGPLRRGLRWMQRHRAKTALLAALVFIAVALPLGLFLHTIGLQGALEETQRERSRASHNETVARGLQYASDMGLANRMLQAGEVFRLSELLDRHAPDPNEATDPRGFEWWYLQWQRHPPPTGLQAHQEAIRFLAYAADGQTLVTSTWITQPLTVWDLASAKPRFQRSHNQSITPALAPRAELLATVDRSGKTVSVWDVKTGAQRARLPLDTAVQAVALSPDGRLLALGGEGPITVWDWAAGKMLRTLPDASRHANQAVFSPDGRSLASYSFPSTKIHLWDPLNGTRRRTLHQQHILRAITYSPRGTFLTAPRIGAEPALWTQDGTPCPTRIWLPPTTVGTSALAISPDDRLLALGMEDGSLQLWDLHTRRRRGYFRWQAAPISRLAFSPNGRTLAVGTIGGTVYQLDTAAPGGPDALRPPLEAVGAVALSADGRTLAVVDADRGVRLLDARTGTIRCVLPPHLNSVALLAFAPDGRTLATNGFEESAIHLWDTTTGRLRQTLRCAHEASAASVTFSPSGSSLVVGRVDGRVDFWDMRTGTERASRIAHRVAVLAAAFSPDGRTLATADANGVVLLWDVSGAELPKARPERACGQGVHSLAFSRDGRTLVTGEADGQIRLWQVGPKGPPLPLTTLTDKSGQSVLGLRLSSDDRTLLGMRRDGRVLLWDLSTRSIRYQLNLESRGLNWPLAALSPDGKALYTVRGDGSLETWSLHEPSVRTTLNQGLGVVHSLAFTPDGGSLVVGSQAPDEILTRFSSLGLGSLLHKEARLETVPLRQPGSTVRLWDLTNRSEQPRLPGPATMASPSLVAVASAGTTLAAGGQDGRVWVWDRAASRLLARRFTSPQAEAYVKGMEVSHLLAVRPEYPEFVCTVALSPDGRLLAAAGSRGAVTLWEADGWRQRHAWKGAECRWVGFAPDGKTLAVARGGQIFLRDPATGTLRRTLGKPSDLTVFCGAFDPHGSLLAVAYANRAIRLWDLQTGKSSPPLIGHGDGITALAFAPDGKTLASSSWDRTARLWSVSAQQEVLTLGAHRGPIHSLTFSPDGKVLVTGGESESGKGEIYLWHAHQSK